MVFRNFNFVQFCFSKTLGAFEEFYLIIYLFKIAHIVQGDSRRSGHMIASGSTNNFKQSLSCKHVV